MDIKYSSYCEMTDELMMISDFDFPLLKEQAKSLSSHMNFYWGNFRMFLDMTNAGKSLSTISGPGFEAH